jgi:hypothetical protein
MRMSLAEWQLHNFVYSLDEDWWYCNGHCDLIMVGSEPPPGCGGGAEDLFRGPAPAGGASSPRCFRASVNG